MPFNQVLEKYRKYSFSERDKGARFERLMQTYLQTDPRYTNLFKYVWLWNEFPGRKDFGGKDIGIDLVALTFDGEYWAIQYKCYQEDGVIDKKAVDSFITTANRSFLNETFEATYFSHLLWISTTNKWGSNAEETIRNQKVPFTRLNLTELRDSPVEWEKLEKGISGDLARTTKHQLRKHQQKALDETHSHFSDFILERAQKIYGKNVGKEDIFYYVYGVLHSPDYREAFANDPKKMLPRIPLVEEPRDFWKFSKAGRELAELHLNYEQVPPYLEAEDSTEGMDNPMDLYEHIRVRKMKFSKKDQKDRIIYNSKLTIENIPEKAYEYVVNGKSAIEWIMERYQVKTDKKSGIVNDPNDWSREVGNPMYIYDLLRSVINVSLLSVEIVEGLPEMRFEGKMEIV